MDHNGNIILNNELHFTKQRQAVCNYILKVIIFAHSYTLMGVCLCVVKIHIVCESCGYKDSIQHRTVTGGRKIDQA